ncbi:EpsG family protein [Serratia sp. JSRIV004]|uniref:EpsG family protein n=1 Tax=Serratia sp. JSRIV004 TaxID=2831895 RepID=UPI001CBE8758|nr:EpsG family protein [Serratia sp. JSRIV004]UAN59426.1 EpsG family protein [Serratia sp. JSRIV004]
MIIKNNVQRQIASESNEYKRVQLIVLFFIATILICIAGFRPVGLDPDSKQYSDLFINYATNGVVDFPGKEAGFWLIAFISDTIFGDNVQAFLFLYAFIAVSLKIYAIYKVSDFPIVSVILYIGFFFVLHEMTQIRIGLAMAFVLLSINDVLSRRPAHFIMKIIIAVFFHYSAVLCFILYFLNPNKINKTKVILFSLLGLFVYIIGNISSSVNSIATIASYLPEFISYKLTTYVSLQDDGKLVKELLITKVGTLVFYLIMFFLIFNIKQGNENEAKKIIICKVISLQLFLGFILAFNVEFSNRIYSLLGAVTFIIAPTLIIDNFKPKWVIYILLIIYAAKQLYSSYNGILTG